MCVSNGLFMNQDYRYSCVICLLLNQIFFAKKIVHKLKRWNLSIHLHVNTTTKKREEKCNCILFFFLYKTHFQFAIFDNILNFAIGLELG